MFTIYHLICGGKPFTTFKMDYTKPLKFRCRSCRELFWCGRDDRDCLVAGAAQLEVPDVTGKDVIVDDHIDELRSVLGDGGLGDAMSEVQSVSPTLGVLPISRPKESSVRKELSGYGRRKDIPKRREYQRLKQREYRARKKEGK